MAKSFIMDSGAFSILNSEKQASKFNPIDYAKKYGTYVRKHNIDNFVELDIDGIFGEKIYNECLDILRQTTGKEPIRVWHLRRGLDYWDYLVDNFNFFMIGGIATGEISLNDEKLFYYLMNKAHSHNKRVHALGVSNINSILKYNFDSVDSASWLSSMQYGKFINFNGRYLNSYKIPKNDDNLRLARRFSGIHALKETVKYSKYLEQF